MSKIEDVKAGLEALKAKVTQLKDRSAKLAAARENLVRQQATLEQTQAQSLAELKELGVEVKDLEPATLEDLADKTHTDLKNAIATLEVTVAEAEALVNGNTQPAAVLNLD